MSEVYMVPVDMEVTNEQYEQLRSKVSDFKASEYNDINAHIKSVLLNDSYLIDGNIFLGK